VFVFICYLMVVKHKSAYVIPLLGCCKGNFLFIYRRQLKT